MIVYSYNGPLHAANCRFVGARLHNLFSSESALCQMRNYQLLCRDCSAIVWDSPPDSRLVITNCLHTGHMVVGNNTANEKNPASVQLTNNTMAADRLLEVLMTMERWPQAQKGDGANKILRVEATGNVLVAGSAPAVLVDGNVSAGSEAEAILAKGVGWKGEGNLFSLSDPFLILAASEKALPPSQPLKNLADWKRFWGSAESGSLTGQVRFRGGNIRGTFDPGFEAVTADDFHLCPDSAGYPAGKDGKDVGANVELVGPGPAYERWKKTPAYQQWLKDAKQVHK